MRVSEKWIGRLLVVGSAAILIVAWHVAASNTSALILPRPVDVVDRFFDYVSSGRANQHILITLYEIFFGFLVGGAAGIGLGVLAAEFEIARRVIMPYVILVQALPKFALAPMLVLWFGFGTTPKIVIAALIAFFPLLENTFLGLKSTPADMLELFRAIKAPRMMTLLKLKVPNAVPAISSGLRVALLFSLVGAVVGEYVGANKGLGAQIIVAQGTLDTELMFVAFILLTIVGFSLDKLHGVASRLVLKRLYGTSLDREMASESSVSI